VLILDRRQLRRTDSACLREASTTGSTRPVAPRFARGLGRLADALEIQKRASQRPTGRRDPRRRRHGAARSHRRRSRRTTSAVPYASSGSTTRQEQVRCLDRHSLDSECTACLASLTVETINGCTLVTSSESAEPDRFRPGGDRRRSAMETSRSQWAASSSSRGDPSHGVELWRRADAGADRDLARRRGARLRARASRLTLVALGATQRCFEWEQSVA
jgi:hypothetical protein